MSLTTIVIEKPCTREAIQLALCLAAVIADIDDMTRVKPSNATIEAIRDEAYTRGVGMIGHEQMDQFVAFVSGGAA